MAAARSSVPRTGLSPAFAQVVSGPYNAAEATRKICHLLPLDSVADEPTSVCAGGDSVDRVKVEIRSPSMSGDVGLPS
jgi:hypothetical protein